MNIVSRSVYVGPNVYAKAPLIRLTVDVNPRDAEALRAHGPAVRDVLSAVVPGFDRDGSAGAGDVLARLALHLQ